MPLAKSSKFRAHMATSNQSPLPLATLCLLGALLLDQINVGTALRCYQGQQSLQQPIQGSPTECPTQSYTCIKTVDYSQGPGYALRACSSTNCSTGGGGYIQTTYNAFCINSTGYPPSTYCCCYGDGCNSATALGSSMGGIGLAFIGLMAALALLKNGGGSARII